MIGLDELLSILACPACRGPLDRAASELVCAACTRRYAVTDGLPELVSHEHDELAHAEAHAHAELAPGYERLHQLETLRNRQAHAELLAPLLALKPGARVLDVACGTGHDSRQLLAAGLDVVGVDITREMLSQARGAVAPGARLALAVADGGALPFQPASFDGVCIVAALHHFREPRRVLAELARVARVGAPVVIGMEPNGWIYWSVVPCWRAIRWLLERLPGRRRVRSPADEETAGLSQAGLAADLAASGIEPHAFIRVWYAQGFLHAALETISKLLQRKRPLAVPVGLERALAEFDAWIARVPLLSRLNWNWTVLATRRRSPPRT